MSTLNVVGVKRLRSVHMVLSAKVSLFIVNPSRQRFSCSSWTWPAIALCRQLRRALFRFRRPSVGATGPPSSSPAGINICASTSPSLLAGPKAAATDALVIRHSHTGTTHRALDWKGAERIHARLEITNEGTKTESKYEERL